MYDYDGYQHILKNDIARKKFPVPIVIDITGMEIENIIVDALESCSNYWVGVDNTGPEWGIKPQGLPVSQFATEIILSGGVLNLYDIEDESKKWQLTLEKLCNGISLAIREYCHSDRLEDCSDEILQYALFGEVVYG